MTLTHTTAGPTTAAVQAAVRATYVAFIATGFAFASWASRIPQFRDRLRLEPAELGLVLLAIAAGSLIALPLAGLIVSASPPGAPLPDGVFLGTALADGCLRLHLRRGAGRHRTVHVRLRPGRLGCGDERAGRHGRTPAGTGDHAPLPRRLQRRHGGRRAGWCRDGRAPRVRDRASGRGGVLIAGVVFRSRSAVSCQTRTSPPRRNQHDRRRTRPGAERLARTPHPAGRHLRPGFAFAEGTGNDWTSVALIDGYGTSAAVGTLGFATFLAAMTAGRWFGPRLLDRYGRVMSLRLAVIAIARRAAVRLRRVTLSLAFVGAILWGAGAVSWISGRHERRCGRARRSGAAGKC